MEQVKEIFVEHANGLPWMAKDKSSPKLPRTSFFASLGDRPYKKFHETNRKEIERYLNYTCEDFIAEYSCLIFWSCHQNECPSLAYCAQKFLCITPSNANCERIGSTSSHTNIKERAKLLGATPRNLILAIKNVSTVK